MPSNGLDRSSSLAMLSYGLVLRLHMKTNTQNSCCVIPMLPYTGESSLSKRKNINKFKNSSNKSFEEERYCLSVSA